MPVDPVPMPDVVAATIEQLHSEAGPVVGQGIRWIPARWRTAALAEVAPLIDALAGRTNVVVDGEAIIRRQHVAEIDDSLALFVASMIWGFGVRGYGPSRVGTMVQAAGAELRSKVDRIVTAARTGPAEAWDAVTDTSKIYGLGPAFGTKLAYFAGFSLGETRLRPLIADANTSWAMWHLVQLERSVERRDSYLTYVNLAHSWAEEHSCRPDDVEWALFEIGKTVPRTLA